ncbi:hypothetical protein JXM83_01930 [Candidatus Woesearchaeota archaeon]|nr:hypothetical protein [Candidatus Woesearchaeota archaeon]
MQSINFKTKIDAYLNANNNLTHTDIGVLLLIDDFYKDIPEDIKAFRKIHSYFDPKILENSKELITFERIARIKKENELKDAICSYLSIKFNQITQSCNYHKCLETFSMMSRYSANFIKDMINVSGLPDEMKEVLYENKLIINEHEFIALLNIYKKAKSRRLKFEILRRISVVDVLSRIRKQYLYDDINSAMNSIKNFFISNLGLEEKNEENVFFWVDDKEHTQIQKDKTKAMLGHKESSQVRKSIGLTEYPLQHITLEPFKTKYGNKILKFEIRNKIERDNEPYYSSFLEKMIRKNLEFPNQIHDLIGVRIVTTTQDEVSKIISHLEKFLGGTSSRKKEKNNLHLFGKHVLSEYSSKEYFVWKAIYDISLPSPRIDELNRLLELISDESIRREIENRKEFLITQPSVMVVEVQIQDLKSYLAGITRGSPTDHARLKMNQVRANTFFKVFPKEIYRKELMKLKNTILHNSIPTKQPQ